MTDVRADRVVAQVLLTGPPFPPVTVRADRVLVQALLTFTVIEPPPPEPEPAERRVWAYCLRYPYNGDNYEWPVFYIDIGDDHWTYIGDALAPSEDYNYVYDAIAHDPVRGRNVTWWIDTEVAVAYVWNTWEILGATTLFTTTGQNPSGMRYDPDRDHLWHWEKADPSLAAYLHERDAAGGDVATYPAGDRYDYPPPFAVTDDVVVFGEQQIASPRHCQIFRFDKATQVITAINDDIQGSLPDLVVAGANPDGMLVNDIEVRGNGTLGVWFQQNMAGGPGWVERTSTFAVLSEDGQDIVRQVSYPGWSQGGSGNRRFYAGSFDRDADGWWLSWFIQGNLGGTGSLASPILPFAGFLDAATLTLTTVPKVPARPDTSEINVIQFARGFVPVEPPPPPPPVGPANDHFVNAQVLSSSYTGTVTGTTVNATWEMAEPVSIGGSPISSVWYRWTPDAAGQVQFNTNGSGFDTILEVFTGPALGSLALEVGDDDAGDGLSSLVEFTAQAGVTYHIRVKSYGSGTGPLTLSRVDLGSPQAPTEGWTVGSIAMTSLLN